MALVFPLALSALSDLLPIASVDWGDNRMEDMSDLGSGEFLTAARGPVLLEAAVTLMAVPINQGEQLRARIRSLDGSSQAFYLSNPMMPWPQADPDGSLFGSAAPVIATINANRKALTLSGLPAAYALTHGDWFHVDGSSPSRRTLMQVMEDVIANGSGATAEFEVRPHLRPSVVAGLEAVFHKPAAKVKILPGSLKESTAGDFTTFTFTARQTLAAG